MTCLHNITNFHTSTPFLLSAHAPREQASTIGMTEANLRHFGVYIACDWLYSALKRYHRNNYIQKKFVPTTHVRAHGNIITLTRTRTRAKCINTSKNQSPVSHSHTRFCPTLVPLSNVFPSIWISSSRSRLPCCNALILARWSERRCVCAVWMSIQTAVRTYWWSNLREYYTPIWLSSALAYTCAYTCHEIKWETLDLC